MSLAASSFGASMQASDNTEAINRFLLALSAPPALHKGIIDGLYKVARPLTVPSGHSLTLEGDQSSFDPGFGCGIVYTGQPGATLLACAGVGKLTLRSLGLYGNDLAATLLSCADGDVSPYNWTLEDVVLNGAASGGTLFAVLSEANCALIRIIRPQWYGNSERNARGFASANPNSVGNLFEGGSIQGCSTAIWHDAGSCHITGTSFANNSEQDVWLSRMNESSLRGCWSEQSNRFLMIPFAGADAAVQIDSCTLSSYPYSYAKLSGKTVPPNPWHPNEPDPAAWAPIVCGREAGLSANNVALNGMFLDQPDCLLQTQLLNNSFTADKAGLWDVRNCRAFLPGGQMTRRVVSYQGTILP